jgi:hypothetical protein
MEKVRAMPFESARKLEVYIEIGEPSDARGVSLTTAEARRLAATLIELCDNIKEVEGGLGF